MIAKNMPETCRSLLTINSASSWFLLHRCKSLLRQARFLLVPTHTLSYLLVCLPNTHICDYWSIHAPIYKRTQYQKSRSRQSASQTRFNRRDPEYK